MTESRVLDKADIVVIGAGIMGSSIGFQLARQSDRRVVIVDERPPVGGISGRTFGQIRRHYSNRLLIEMATRGFEVLSTWPRSVGYGDPGYVRLGYLLLATEDQAEACRRNVKLGSDLGVDTRFIAASEIAEIEPLLAVVDDLAGAAYEPDGGYIDVTRMVLSWLLGAQDHGATLHSGLRVETIDLADDRISGVTTAAGRIEAPVVVNATGPWAPDLLDLIGVNLPMERRRLDMALMKLPTGQANLTNCVTDGSTNLVLRPDMGSYMMAVTYPEEMPKVEDPLGAAPDADLQAHESRFDSAFRRRLPGFVGAEPVRWVSGVYDITPDYHPILGWAPNVEGLYLAVGFSGHGLKLSPAVGEVVAAAVLEREPPFDVSPLRPTRFAEDDLMFLAYGPSARA